MIASDIKSLLLHLNQFCTDTLQGAAGLCVSRTHYEITVEHFILKLVDEPVSDWQLIFGKFAIDPGKFGKSLNDSIEEYRTGNAARPVFSPLLLELLQGAWLISSIDLGDRAVRSGAVLLALLSRSSLYMAGRPAEMLRSISRDALLRDFRNIARGSIEEPAPAGEAGPARPGPPGTAGGSFIGRFCIDFTARAAGGDIDPVFGRDKEIRQMIDVLARRRKNNPICVGEPGVGKTAVVEGLALRIIENDVPDMLRGTALLGLDMGLLEAGAGVKGEFENRLRGVITEIKSSEKPIVLFIDEAHTLIGAGAAAGGSDAANLLKPALARGELRTIGATTWSEYKKYFEKDPALARRFQLVKLEEPTVESTVLMLRGLKANYEKAHGVIVRDDAVRAAAELSDRCITGRFLPDKAIDLMDTSCARVKINLTAKPALIEQKERESQALAREKTALDRDIVNGANAGPGRIEEIAASLEKLNAETDVLKARWEKEKDAAAKVLDARAKVQASAAGDSSREELTAGLDRALSELKEIQQDRPFIHIEVDPDVVAQVVSDWTGIPLGKVLRDEADTIINLEERLKEKIKGQDHAMSALAELIKAAKAGIKNPSQPMGVFLFVGPSGTGKTETGLVLADLLFGSERNVVTINLSEFQEGYTISRLIGSPPGYVGFGEGGMLTEAVRQKPYSVVLLDEAEKAHMEVMNLFYQVFDKGALTDGEGKEISFRNTVIILTSNLASDVIQELTASPKPVDRDALVGAVRPILSAHFKPALLARMTIVPYYSLEPEAMRLIAELKLKRVQKTLMENSRMALNYSRAVVNQVHSRCTEVEAGARNIEYIINGNILPRLSQNILTHMGKGTMPSAVELDVDAEGNFTFRFTD